FFDGRAQAVVHRALGGDLLQHARGQRVAPDRQPILRGQPHDAARRVGRHLLGDLVADAVELDPVLARHDRPRRHHARRQRRRHQIGRRKRFAAALIVLRRIGVEHRAGRPVNGLTVKIAQVCARDGNHARRRTTSPPSRKREAAPVFSGRQRPPLKKNSAMPDSPAPRKRWFLKGLAILGQLLGELVLLAALLVIVRGQIPWTLDAAGADERWQRIALTAATIDALLCGLRHGLRRPRQLGRALLCFAIAAIAGWLWLAWDDPKLDFPPEDYLSAADSPEAEASHALVLRYRSGEDSRLPAGLPDLREPHSLAGNKTPTNEQWTAFVTEHRDEIQQGWDQLADHRAWIAEMAAAPRLADLTTSIGDPIPSFRDLRAPARYMTWQARALALEGRGDEALAEVATLLAVSQKLTPESRTLVRGMIAVVMQKMALQTADFVLTTTETSTESRTHLLAVVTARQNPADAARLLVW